MEERNRHRIAWWTFLLVYAVNATTISQFFDADVIQARLFDDPLAADLSLTFLRILFGNVSTLGGSNVITGEIFRMFNYGVFAVVSVTIGYTVLTSVLGASQDGAGAFSNRVSPWTLFRTVTGVSVMVPLSTGYSVIQTVVMKMVLLGVSLANTIWAGALVYHQTNGGTIYLNPQFSSRAATAPSPLDIAPEASRYVSELYEKIWGKYETLCQSDTQCQVDSRVEIVSGTKDLRYIFRKRSNGQEECFDLEALLPTELMGTSASVRDTRVQQALTQARLSMGGPVRQLLQRVIQNYETPLFTVSTSTSPTSAQQPVSRWQQSHYAWNPNWTTEPSDIQTIRDNARARITQTNGTIVSAAIYYATAMSAAYPAFRPPQSSTNTNWQAAALSSGWLASGMYYNKFLAPEPTTGGTNSNQGGSLQFSYTPSTTPQQVWLAPPSTVSNPSSNYDISNMGLLAVSEIARLRMTAQIQAVRSAITPPPPSSLNNFSQNVVRTLLNSRETPSGPTLDQRIADRIKDFWEYLPQGGRGSRAAYALIPNLSGKTAGATAWIYGVDVAYPISTLAIMLNRVFIHLLGIDESQGQGGTCHVMYSGASPAPGILPGTMQARVPSYYLQHPECLHKGSLLHTALFPDTNVNAISMVQSLGHAMVKSSVTYYRDTIEGLFTEVKKLADHHFGIASALNISAAAVEAPTYGSMLAILGAVASTAAEIINTGLKMAYNGTKVALDMYIPVGTAAAAMLFTLGIILGVYLPMLPFLLFLFGSVAWLMSVIEAMVAAPLVALGVTHPEGHDILGKAEQAMMLLLGVFIRPSMMLFGMIMSIIVSQLLLKLFHFGFLQIVASFFSTSSGTGPEEMSILVVGALLIYVYVLINVIEQSFSLVYVIPERIMRWVGGPQDQTGVGQLAEQTKGEVQQGAGQAAQGASQSTVAPQLQPTEAQVDTDGNDKAEKEDDGKGDGKGSGGTGSAGGGNKKESKKKPTGNAGGGSSSGGPGNVTGSGDSDESASSDARGSGGPASGGPGIAGGGRRSSTGRGGSTRSSPTYDSPVRPTGGGSGSAGGGGDGDPEN